MPRANCHLCNQEADLRNSHILPSFAFRWLRESSGNGHLRTTGNVNQRVQDGLKRYWLCGSCEEILGQSESTFASQIFHPYLTESGRYFRYQRWLMHFCTSLSWRVLHFFLEETDLSDWQPESLSHVHEAERVWRELLLNQRPHPGQFQQHILPLDRIESATFPLAPNANRYLTRAIDMDICRGSQNIFIYSKFGRFVVLGFIHEPNPNHWRGTKVNANEGLIGPGQYTLPHSFADYLNRKANRMAERLGNISERQQARIESSFRSNIDDYINSDSFSAMLADINMFGDSAFSTRNRASEP